MPGATPPVDDHCSRDGRAESTQRKDAVSTDALGVPASSPSAAPVESGRRLHRAEWVVVFLLVVGLVAVDLATKSVAQRRLGGRVRGSLVVIPGVLSFTYRENTGGPFSLLADSEWAWVLGPLAVVATLAVIWWLLSSPAHSRLEVLACGTIVGGAVGNLVDRYQFGAVRDFINLTCIRWPVFNSADVFICIGVVLLFWDLLVNPRHKAPTNQA